jgi:hypothetical protein
MKTEASLVWCMHVRRQEIERGERESATCMHMCTIILHTACICENKIRKRKRGTDRQQDRQTDIQTQKDRERDRQKDRQREREREAEGRDRDTLR